MFVAELLRSNATQTQTMYSEVLNKSTGSTPKNIAVRNFICSTIKINSKIWVAVILFQWYLLFEKIKRRKFEKISQMFAKVSKLLLQTCLFRKGTMWLSLCVKGKDVVIGDIYYGQLWSLTSKYNSAATLAPMLGILNQSLKLISMTSNRGHSCW